jgi:hypothetical protein
VTLHTERLQQRHSSQQSASEQHSSSAYFCEQPVCQTHHSFCVLRCSNTISARGPRSGNFYNPSTRTMSAATRLALTAIVSLVPLVASYHTSSSFLNSVSNSAATIRASCMRPQLRTARMQLGDEKIKIPDSFNPAEWAKRSGGGGGLGGFRVPDSFNPGRQLRITCLIYLIVKKN